MSWSGGNKRWTASFKSLNNTTCRIDVYQRGYNGVFVQTVKAAADPFFYEEEEDSDLLNTVLRYQTGYIRLVEEYESSSTFSMTDIYPQAAFDRWVEVYYGSTLIFNGYIQVQDFSNELVPVPKVIELPVISPLGLMEQRTFSNTAYLPPSEKSLGQLLDDMLYNTNYTKVYVPDKCGYPDPVSLSMKISTLAVSPWNEDYHHSMNLSPSSKVMKGESHAFLLEAICKAFGWICHESTDALIFTAFDYEDTYSYYPVGHIGDTSYRVSAGIPATATLLDDYCEPCDNQATETTLLPETGIEINYTGDDNTREFSFQRTFAPNDAVEIMPSFIPDMDNYPNHAEIFSLCNLTPVPLTNEFQGIYSNLSFDENDKINPGRGCCAWNGKEGVMISLSGADHDQSLFGVRFYIKRRTSQKYGFDYDFIGRNDGILSGLQNPDVDSRHVTYSLDVSHDDYIEASFYYRVGAEFPALNLQALLFIYNIKLEVFEDGKPYSEYIFKPTGDSDVIPAEGNPAISSDIDMPISLYRMNDHLIGSEVRSTKLTEYPYLFLPRKELNGRFKIVDMLTFPHVRLIEYQRKNWRIIAQRFNPWNDEMTLTMQHSSLL